MQDKNSSYTKNKFDFKSIKQNIGFSSFSSALMAIFLGLIFGFLVMIIAKPGSALAGFQYVVLGGFNRVGDVFYFATPILMTGLAVGFAFKMGLFNIGASGQYTMGMFFALYVGLMWDLPSNIHWAVAVLAGMVGGMIWGFIPGIFKALLNVNEVITSIMFNYIGMYLVDMIIQGSSIMYVSSKTRTNYIPADAQIPSLGIPGSNVNLGIILAIIIALILYIVLQKTTFGYELKATGFNKHASEYAGMKGKKNIIITMIIAGGLAGLGGAFAILAPSAIAGSSMTYEPINIIAPNGFNGIAVALLGNSHPIGTIFSAVFISHIQRGGTLASLVGFKPEIIDVVIAVIIYFSAFAMIMSSALGKFVKGRFRKTHTSNELENELIQTDFDQASDNNTREAE
ncbi:ABC transporter permease [Proteiniborus sp. MB09-C3]|uniref:ABC transporter permease n=1 Tax=Proteiniborus sp. MB09-C3 TaxID=3050072 RepID=UPI002552C2A8|nr:ABC transporter permease [Proteiniborus sp. MB09-C3]WIV10406.1 ABC transporter permease [Proteiniborus sp. MB09-C3]